MKTGTLLEFERQPADAAWMQGLTVPGHWSRTRVKYLVQSMRAGDVITVDAIEESGEFPVYGANGRRGFTSHRTHQGRHVLIGRQGALCGNVHLVSGEFWASEHAIVAKPATGIDDRWLAALLRVMNLGQYSTSAAQPGIGVGQIAPLHAYVPPLDEQRAIADYLDRETAQIDALVAKQEEFIGLLRGRRSVAVDSFVWSGLDQAVEMADAGLGPVTKSPQHWRRLRNKNLFREVSVLSKDGSEELLTVSHLTGVTPRSMKNVNMFEAITTEGYKTVQVGDLAINTMWAWMGALGVSNYCGIVSPAYGVYRPIVDDIDGRYFDHLYRTARYVVEMTRHSRGVTSSRLRLYPDSFLRLNVVVPPKPEQTAIADQIDDQIARIDALIAKAEEHIALAKERRSALITAAVTGQIDVRTASRKAG